MLLAEVEVEVAVPVRRVPALSLAAGPAAGLAEEIPAGDPMAPFLEVAAATGVPEEPVARVERAQATVRPVVTVSPVLVVAGPLRPVISRPVEAVGELATGAVAGGRRAATASVVAAAAARDRRAHTRPPSPLVPLVALPGRAEATQEAWEPAEACN